MRCGFAGARQPSEWDAYRLLLLLEGELCSLCISFGLLQFVFCILDHSFCDHHFVLLVILQAGGDGTTAVQMRAKNLGCLVSSYLCRLQATLVAIIEIIHHKQ